ncbi:DinB family protein [Chitinophaga silvatica]|uniref:DinB family protein n=1 Tax=Chitinophaga silvatica TaxID=2282649 RepID=A0A3E1Y8R3_9BACT|nr:DinB family protein [Chitinophaga silvatica]RFS21793.1 DinB family protein [Chitinophaga silvatica]
MNASISIIRQSRTQLIGMIDRNSTATLNKIPEGFKNNIIWNIGHVLVSMEAICYKRAGMPMCVDPILVSRYANGTTPLGDADEKEIAEIKALLVASVDQIEKDYTADAFVHYTPWTTGTGIPINSIDDALAFAAYHDGMHMGCILGLRKFL